VAAGGVKIWSTAAAGTLISLLLAGLVHAVAMSRAQAERMAVELDAHRRTEQSLDVALTKYRTLFDSFPLGITVAGEDGAIVEANLIAETILGISREEQLRRTLGSAVWDLIRPDGTLMPPSEYPSILALQTRHGLHRADMGIRKPDGRVTWLSVVATHLPLPGYGVVVTYADITERVREQQARETLSAAARLAVSSDDAADFCQALAELLSRALRFPWSRSRPTTAPSGRWSLSVPSGFRGRRTVRCACRSIRPYPAGSRHAARHWWSSMRIGDPSTPCRRCGHSAP
jgi:PAS domain S-box-containing protein